MTGTGPVAAGTAPVTIVTGGSGSIGRAICSCLSRNGHDIALTFHRNEVQATEVVQLVSNNGRRGHHAAVDLEDRGGVAAFVAGVAERFGRIDGFVSAAAPVPDQVYTSQIDPESFGRQLHEDTGGFFTVLHEVLPHLRESRGSVVAITTVATRRYIVRDVLSSAPKAAVEAVIRAIAYEEGRFGVRANAVGVGVLDSGMAETLQARGQVRPEDLEHILSQIPLRRFGTVDAVAEAAAFLASPKAAYVTGQVLGVDGGYSL